MQAILFSPHADEAAVLTLILQQAGVTIRSVRSLDQAVEEWPERPSDLVLAAFIQEDAKEVRQIERMRMSTDVPICVISNMIPEDLQVEFLEAGADLIVTRPYGVRFLLAQIKALLRRNAGVPFFSLPLLTHLDVILDPTTRTVKVGEDSSKHLTQLEFRLLYTLMTHNGQILPAEKIVEYVWGFDGEGNRELVRGLVQRLRSKVEPTPGKPRYILTEPGVGYYFNRYEVRD